jgi:hypothetical protein
VRHDRPGGPLGGVSLRLAGGLYRQYVTQSKVSSAEPTSVVPSLRFWLPLDASVSPPRAYHVSGGVLLATGRPWTLRLEAYGKWHPRIHQFDYARLTANARLQQQVRALPDQSAFLAAGNGRSYGASLTLERSGERVEGGATLAWSTAERRYPGRFDDRWVAAPWEEPVRLNGHASVEVVGGLRARARWESIWGRSWALRRIYYDYVGPSGALSAPAAPGEPAQGLSLDTPGDDRLAGFHRLDLGVRGTWTWRGVAVDAELSVVNALGRANPFDASLRPDGDTFAREHRLLPGRRIVTVLGLRF